MVFLVGAAQPRHQLSPGRLQSLRLPSFKGIRDARYGRRHCARSYHRQAIGKSRPIKPSIFSNVKHAVLGSTCAISARCSLGWVIVPAFEFSIERPLQVEANVPAPLFYGVARFTTGCKSMTELLRSERLTGVPSVDIIRINHRTASSCRGTPDTVTFREGLNSLPRGSLELC